MEHTTLQQVIDAKVKLTPMMQQYSSIKEKYDDHILLFRMGDFYEVFFEDATKASKLLNITLTHRGKIGNFPIPMAGIPHHAAAVYIDRLSNMGLKVAICEQIQDPKDAKGIVKRAVTQVVSPGLPFDLDKTEANEQRYIASASFINGVYQLVVIDFTTGEFTGAILNDEEAFINKLRHFNPKELITFMGQWEETLAIKGCIENLGILKTYLSEEYFNSKYTEVYIQKLINAYKSDRTLKDHSELLGPIGALSYYICSTQELDSFFHIRPFRLINTEGHMKVTQATLEGLEILPRMKERYSDSLLGFMDKTQTAMGSRKLRTLFLNPLYDRAAIENRNAAVSDLCSSSYLEKLETIRSHLSEIRDIERILAKASTNKANSGDLINSARAICAYEEILKLLPKDFKEKVSKLSKKQRDTLNELSTEVLNTLNDEIGASLEKGNLIKTGFNKKRDKLARLALNAAQELTALEANYRKETGIAKLRIKSNNVAGYFIEISKSHSSKVPDTFKRRQTLVNSERYSTSELTSFEKEIIAAKDKLERLEREIFKGLMAKLNTHATELQSLADVLSEYDCLQSFSWIAIQEEFVRPQFSKVTDQKELNISGAWHPLIKKAIKDQFVCHDVSLTQDSFFGLITGPNMAGKTTVMREVAIIQILAQMGSFVPATSAKLSLCDFLFSRLGASDDILKGQSTFMVEMAETAEIIRHATEKSLVILDEVGRGTSTYDGLSIAWALVEELIYNTKSLTLFATHYHELIEVIDQAEHAKNYTVETKNNGDDVQFLYRLIEQGASQSFGIYVAKLAGLPDSMLHRAREILDKLEAHQTPAISSSDQNEVNILNPKNAVLRPVGKKKKNQQLSFFPDEQVRIEIPSYLKKIEKELESIDLNNSTPLELMNRVNGLKEELSRSKMQ